MIEMIDIMWSHVSPSRVRCDSVETKSFSLPPGDGSVRAAERERCGGGVRLSALMGDFLCFVFFWSALLFSPLGSSLVGSWENICCIVRADYLHIMDCGQGKEDYDVEFYGELYVCLYNVDDDHMDETPDLFAWSLCVCLTNADRRRVTMRRIIRFPVMTSQSVDDELLPRPWGPAWCGLSDSGIIWYPVYVEQHGKNMMRTMWGLRSRARRDSPSQNYSETLLQPRY